MRRSTRNLLLKIVVSIPLIWFCAIGISVVFTGKNFSQNEPSVKTEIPSHEKHMQVLVNHDLPKSTNKVQLEALRSKHNQHLFKNERILADDQYDIPDVQRPDKNLPGEEGKPMIVNDKKLPPNEKEEFDKGWKNNAFNEYASKRISMHRNLPDVRDKECKQLKYRKDLPDTTVIVVFHNEAWTVLLRTIYSILERSPVHLIREVIIVDDASNFEHLGKRLEDYIKQKLPKVKLLRAKSREGLIRARLLGAEEAKGDVLTFLDSHCECTKGWLEPMLDRIADNWSNVVTPVIDVIEDGTFKYVYGSARSTSVGGFDWNLQFNWHSIPKTERNRRSSFIDPIRSPTMAGGLFSMDRQYFNHLGTYDKGMEIWGGENLEMSFRIWMCGGTLEIIPCSHVGHIFRKRSPYKWKSNVNVVKRNTVRLAEVWMDEYKQNYYDRYNNDLGDFGDVTDRKELRKRLNCKSFKWYLKNIFPELFIPGDAIAKGEIRNKAAGMCLDAAVSRDSDKKVKLWPCHNQGGNQYWMMSKTGEIRRDEMCFDFAGNGLTLYSCHGDQGNQYWEYSQSQEIRHVRSAKCLELVNGNKIEVNNCDNRDSQKWIWKRS